MIDEEIKTIIRDTICHSQEMLKFLKNLRNGKYNPYLEDLIDYATYTEEDLKAIEHYILQVEINLYDALNGGENHEK